MVATAMVLSGTGLPITGFANHLYAGQEASIARHAWMAAHNSLAIVFAAFVIAHVVTNGGAVWRYMTAFASHRPAAWDCLWAVAIVTITTTLAVGHAFLLPR
jgi:hypothetical protein